MIFLVASLYFILWFICLLTISAGILSFIKVLFRKFIIFLCVISLLILILVFHPVWSLRFRYRILWRFYRLIIYILIFIYVSDLMRILKICPLIVVSRRLQILYLIFFLSQLIHFFYIWILLRVDRGSIHIHSSWILFRLIWINWV